MMTVYLYITRFSHGTSSKKLVRSGLRVAVPVVLYLGRRGYGEVIGKVFSWECSDLVVGVESATEVLAKC